MLFFVASALDNTLFSVVIVILTVILAVLLAVLLAALIREMIRSAKKSSETSDTAVSAADDDWTPPEPVAYPARIVDMRAVIGNVGGHKRPKTGTSFLVTFLTDDGETLEYPVPEELYVTLNIDQTGTLVILNEGFFDFGDGEDVEEAPHAE